jgi:hypothetical protein
MDTNDHRACEIRYRALLARLEDMSEQIEQLERGQRRIVDLLRDFRELVRLVVERVKASDRRIEDLAVRQIPFHGRIERIARHFRN